MVKITTKIILIILCNIMETKYSIMVRFLTNVLCEVLAQLNEVIFRYKTDLSTSVSSLVPIRIRGRPINHLQPLTFAKAQFCVILRLKRIQGHLKQKFQDIVITFYTLSVLSYINIGLHFSNFVPLYLKCFQPTNMCAHLPILPVCNWMETNLSCFHVVLATSLNWYL